MTFFYRHGHASVGRPARIYLHQLCADTGCRLEDPPGVINDRDEWRESGKSVLSARLDDPDWQRKHLELPKVLITSTNFLQNPIVSIKISVLFYFMCASKIALRKLWKNGTKGDVHKVGVPFTKDLCLLKFDSWFLIYECKYPDYPVRIAKEMSNFPINISSNISPFCFYFCNFEFESEFCLTAYQPLWVI